MSSGYGGGIEIIEVPWGQPIDLRVEPFALQYVPTEFYIKPDGAKDDKPCLVIVMRHPVVGVAFGQITYAMLKPVIEALERAERAARTPGGGEGP